MCSPCDCGHKGVPNGAQSELTPSELKQCRRCGSEPFVCIDKVRIECRQCFSEFCNKKFRTTIGKSKLVKNNESILLAYSGGPNSTALLDLIHSSMMYDAGRDQKFKVSILHIDTSSISRLQSDLLGDHELEKHAGDIDKRIEFLARRYPKWPIYFTTIEKYFTESHKMPSNSDFYPRHEPLYDCPAYLKYTCDIDLYSREYKDSILELCNDEAAEGQMRSFLENTISDKTDRQRIVCDCCFRLIDRVAADIKEREDPDLKFVMTGSAITRLSNDLLVDVILGRGSNIGHDVKICDRRTRIPIMRPLREFSSKEIAYYLKARDILKDVCVTPNLMTFTGRKDTIQSLTESFLSRLSLDFPSTYNTLLNTGNKMNDTMATADSNRLLPAG